MDAPALEPESFLTGDAEQSEAVMVSLPGQPNKQQMELSWGVDSDREAMR